MTNRRKVGMTSSQHAPYVLGDTRTTMVGTKGSELARASESQQTRPQFRLQAATRLHEGGIASNRRSAYGGEFVPGPYTPPVTPWKLVTPEVITSTFRGGGCLRQG